MIIIIIVLLFVYFRAGWRCLKTKRRSLTPASRYLFEKVQIHQIHNQNVTNTHKVNKYKICIKIYANVRLKTCKVEDSECSAWVRKRSVANLLRYFVETLQFYWDILLSDILLQFCKISPRLRYWDIKLLTRRVLTCRINKRQWWQWWFPRWWWQRQGRRWWPIQSTEKLAKSDDIIGDQVTWSAMELGCTDSNFFGNKE